MTHGNRLSFFLPVLTVHEIYYSTHLPTFHSTLSTKEGFKSLWTWYFSLSYSCTSGTMPVTTRIHNRGPKYWNFPCICDILNSFANIQSAHWNGHVCTLYTNNRTCQIAYKYAGIKICYKIDKFAFEGNKNKVVRGIVLT